MCLAMDSLSPAKIIRSRRRTISLEITKDAVLIVRAPLRAPDTSIARLIREKQAWIEKKMAEVRSRRSRKKKNSSMGSHSCF